MNRIISTLCALTVFAAGAFAQGPAPREGHDGWRERVRAEKVAFLTEQIDLTESEAQVFWPIYNQIQQDQREAFEAVKQAFDAMQKGLEAGKTGKEMENLVHAYIDAKDKSDDVGTKYLNKLLKALPAEKVARYYVAEEKFRHQQIGRLGKGGVPAVGNPQQGQRRNGGDPSGNQRRGRSGQRRNGGETPAEI